MVLIAACSGGRDVPDGYGATTERNFTQGCVAALSDPGGEPSYDATVQDVCGCAYAEITSPSGITYERFREINAAQEDKPSALPDELRDIVDACRPESTATGEDDADP